MKRRLFWTLCLVIGGGTVVLFYIINVLTARTEAGMSYIDEDHQQELKAWGQKAETLYLAGQYHELDQWLQQLQKQESTWAAVIESDLQWVGGGQLNQRFYEAFTLGRGVEWKIHLYFPDNPIIEIRFANQRSHFAMLLPDRMRPGIYWAYTSVILQIVLPIILLTLLSVVLYRHIMAPLAELKTATHAFSSGNFNVRVRQQLGKRGDELADLAETFDTMAQRIGELILSQGHLISDLSHELRTPLARMDIAIEKARQKQNSDDIERISYESQHLRKLVEDTLTLAWLENERPDLRDESLDLIDLLDVLNKDARFEFANKHLVCKLDGSLEIQNSNHRALGQALENIIRNAMRHTPAGGTVSIELSATRDECKIDICDEGPGVAKHNIDRIFAPFARLEPARDAHLSKQPSGFGLGLALAKRQIQAIGGAIHAENLINKGLKVSIILPKM